VCVEHACFQKSDEIVETDDTGGGNDVRPDTRLMGMKLIMLLSKAGKII
jgi:hypothetical protein